MTKKIIAVSIMVFLLLVVAGFLVLQIPQQADYKFSGPEQVVRQYFESWGKGDWPNMYATISDGFKKIEPTAKTFSDFRQYAESQNIKSVKMLEIKEESNNGETAIVDYSVEFTLADNTKKSFSENFTLKFREADVIKGWKLIHPYGTKIDVT